MGIQPETSHHETGPGQHEVDFKYSAPLQSADNLGTFKMIVKTVAARNGLYACFLPKPLDNEAGSGLHINISLLKDGKNIFSDDELPEDARQFMAGILYRIREITAFLNPLKQSYERFGLYEAPFYISWSRLNRSQLIRVPAADEERRRMELRSPDPSCNQYTALSLIISAGLEGIEKHRKLAAEADINMFKASPSAVKDMETLPRTFSEAVSLAQESDFVKSVLPEITVRTFSEYGGDSEEFPLGNK